MGKSKKTKFKNLPKHKKFLYLVSRNITSIDVLFLSELDRGQDAENHAEKINLFRETLDTFQMDSWYPMEVWELNRWSAPGYLDTIGHGRRAFSCTALLACTLDNVRASIELLDIVFPLYESLMRLELPEWQVHFFDLLQYGIDQTTSSEDRFKLHLTWFLTLQSNEKDSVRVAEAFDRLMAEELKMLEGFKNHIGQVNGNNEIERPRKIVDTYITHGTAYMFVAKEIYAKSMQIEDTELSEKLMKLSQRIAWLRGDNVEDFLPSS